MPTGGSSFERLQRRFTQTDADAIEHGRRELPVLLFAFDLLEVCGVDVRDCGVEARKTLLAGLLPPAGPLTLADHLDGRGAEFFELVRERELEGVVAKRAGSRYEPGARSADWVKVKVPRTVSVAIVGVVPGKGSRRALGSLMVAGLEGDTLVYVGNVGSGLAEDVTDLLERELGALRQDDAPCAGLPETLPAGSYFVAPVRFCEVRYTERTSAGSLRHPVFLGLRDDVGIADCALPASRDAIPDPVAPPPRSAIRTPHHPTREDLPGPSRATPRAICSPITKRSGLGWRRTCAIGRSC